MKTGDFSSNAQKKVICEWTNFIQISTKYVYWCWNYDFFFFFFFVDMGRVVKQSQSSLVFSPILRISLLHIGLSKWSVYNITKHFFLSFLHLCVCVCVFVVNAIYSNKKNFFKGSTALQSNSKYNKALILWTKIYEINSLLE